MTVYANKWNWTTSGMDRVPVDEKTLQEILDFLFAPNERWLQEVQFDTEMVQRRLRRWQSKLYAAAQPEPVAPIEVKVVPMKWPAFLAAQRRAGLTATQAAEVWKARKAG